MFESAYKLDSLSLVVYSEYSGKFYAPQLSDFASLEEGRLYRRQSISRFEPRAGKLDRFNRFVSPRDRSFRMRWWEWKLRAGRQS